MFGDGQSDTDSCMQGLQLHASSTDGPALHASQGFFFAFFLFFLHTRSLPKLLQAPGLHTSCTAKPCRSNCK